MANDYSKILPVLFARSLPALRSTCVLTRRVNRDFENTPAGVGDTINVKLTRPKTVTDVVPAATNPTPPDAQSDKVPLKLNRWKHTGFHFTDKERGELEAGQSAKEGDEVFKALGEFVNADLFGLYKKIPTYVGTAGTTPFNGNLNAAAAARGQLNRQRVPNNERFLAIDTNADVNANSYLLPFQIKGDKSVQEEGVIARVQGFDWYYDQQAPQHVAGTGGTITINGAQTVAGSQGGVADSINGRLGVVSIANNGAGALNAGDLFTVAGDATQYTVLNEVGQAELTTTAWGGAGNKSFVISPALQSNKAGGEVIARIGSHQVNLALHRDAINFGSRRLTSDSKNEEFTVADPVTGIIVRCEVIRGYKLTWLDFDILYGLDLIRPEFGCRLLG